MRDPVGASSYTGATDADWAATSAYWTTANKALVPYGVDPTATVWKDKGYFVLPKSKFSK